MILKRNLAPICFSLLLAITATGCQVSAQQSDGSQTSTEVSTSTLTETNSEETFFNTEQVHTIDLEVDETVLAEMIAAYQEDGSKNWIEATVTIDGETFQNVGLKLKGNYEKNCRIISLSCDYTWIWLSNDSKSTIHYWA